MNIIHGLGRCVGYVATGTSNFFSRVAEWCCPTGSDSIPAAKQNENDGDFIELPETSVDDRDVSFSSTPESRLTQSLEELGPYLHDAQKIIGDSQTPLEMKIRKFDELVALLLNKDQSVQLGVERVIEPFIIINEGEMDEDLVDPAVSALTRYLNETKNVSTKTVLEGGTGALSHVIRWLNHIIIKQGVDMDVLIKLKSALDERNKNLNIEKNAAGLRTQTGDHQGSQMYDLSFLVDQTLATYRALQALYSKPKTD